MGDDSLMQSGLAVSQTELQQHCDIVQQISAGRQVYSLRPIEALRDRGPLLCSVLVEPLGAKGQLGRC